MDTSIDDQEYQEYRRALIKLILSINEQIPIAEPNQVLIVYTLNTIPKIQNFVKKIKERLNEEILNMTEVEVVRAAVHAGKGI